MNVLKLLFNPIFLLAAGLHAGLLLIPVAGGSSDTVVPAPDPEGESITVTRIPPKASQPAKPTGPEASTTAATRPAVVAPRPASGQPAAKSRPQSGQAPSSSTRTAARQSDRSQPTQPTNNGEDSGGGLPELPPIGGNSPGDSDSRASSNATANTGNETNTVQTPPTLVSLKQKATARREVPQLLQTFLARLQHSVLRTTDPETAEAEQRWLASLTENPQLDISTAAGLENSLEISYPYTADDGRRFVSCLTPVPEKGLMGVVVDADGAISNQPTLLRSSGYEFLNEIALDQISAYTDFPEADVQKAYTIDIDIDYDQNACVSLAELQAD